MFVTSKVQKINAQKVGIKNIWKESRVQRIAARENSSTVLAIVKQELQI